MTICICLVFDDCQKKKKKKEKKKKKKVTISETRRMQTKLSIQSYFPLLVQVGHKQFYDKQTR